MLSNRIMAATPLPAQLSVIFPPFYFECSPQLVTVIGAVVCNSTLSRLCIGCLQVCTRGKLPITASHKAWHVSCHGTGTARIVAAAVLVVIPTYFFFLNKR
jgi:hypothetical protein